MVSDEEILERAFLSALRQHFKKPGPWLPLINVSAGNVYPDAKGIPQGQVWEVYVLPSDPGDYIALKDSMNPLGSCDQSGTAAVAPFWLPGFSFLSTVWDGAALLVTPSSYCTDPQGWLLGDGDFLLSAGGLAFVVRARRRFDLET